MSLTVNAKTYVASSVSPNIVGYTGPSHSVSTKDVMSLGRTAAKPTSVFSGVVRSDTKLTRTLTLTGALTTTGDAIFELKTSIPVGASATDIETALDDLAAFFASTAFQDAIEASQVFL